MNFVLKDLKQMAMVGGVEMGGCCHSISAFYQYTSEIVSNSLYVLVAWAAVWVLLGVINFVHRFIADIQTGVQYANYFALSIHLILSFHIFYSSMNALYHFSI